MTIPRIMLHRIIHSYPARFAFLMIAGMVALVIFQIRKTFISPTNTDKYLN
jgi:hypothetical protein